MSIWPLYPFIIKQILDLKLFIFLIDMILFSKCKWAVGTQKFPIFLEFYWKKKKSRLNKSFFEDIFSVLYLHYHHCIPPWRHMSMWNVCLHVAHTCTHTQTHSHMCAYRVIQFYTKKFEDFSRNMFKVIQDLGLDI